MSVYRMCLAAMAAMVLAVPAFADDNSSAKAAVQSQQVTQTNGADTKINVNKATSKELMQVKGLTASKARAIVAYRKKQGDFKSIDALAKVKGFKKVKADEMKQIEAQLTVE